MSIIATSVPPPEAPGAATRGPAGGESAVPGPLRFVGRALRTLWSNGKARAGLIMLGIIILVALSAPLIAPHSPTATTFTPYLGPSGTNWLGTTGNGQDVFSQLIYGARISLIVGLCAGALATLVAVTFGLISGYRPGLVDEVLSFATNLALVVPSLPLMIVLAAYIQGHSVWTIVLVVAFTSWATGARVIRSQVKTLRAREFVTSAVFSGERLFRVAFREILPNMTSLVAASFFAAATAAVLAEASLEFLGLGNPATVSWGTILYAAQQQNALLTGQWAMVLAPGLAIVLLMVSFTLINFGVDALSNPRLREK
jgi:peptide/nickel transport system permease protein